MNMLPENPGGAFNQVYKGSDKGQYICKETNADTASVLLHVQEISDVYLAAVREIAKILACPMRNNYSDKLILFPQPRKQTMPPAIRGNDTICTLVHS